VVFVFASINMLYYIYRFAYVETTLHPWDEADLTPSTKNVKKNAGKRNPHTLLVRM
jgi:hypothetical protein